MCKWHYKTCSGVISLGDSAIVLVLNSYRTMMIWLIDEPVIARADDSLIRLEMETRPLCFLPKGEMTRSLFIFTLEFLLETMCEVVILNPEWSS
jgi:hypothetical protein